MSIDQRFICFKWLSQKNHRVVNCSIAMRVVIPHNVTNSFCGLAIPLVGCIPCEEHRIQKTTLHGLEPITRVWNRTILYCVLGISAKSISEKFGYIYRNCLFNCIQSRVPPYSSYESKSTFSYSHCLRNSDLVPIKVVILRSAILASITSILRRVLVSGHIVVSHNWSGFISPSPLYRCSSNAILFLESVERISASSSSVQAYVTVNCFVLPLPLEYVTLYRGGMA